LSYTHTHITKVVEQKAGAGISLVMYMSTTNQSS
jgi:hypothetical protein